MQKYVNLADHVKSFQTSAVESCAMSKRSSLSMYVIATVFCSNFHFSVSLHVPFSQFLFERDSYSNAYLVLTIYLQNFVSIQPRTSPVKFAAAEDIRARNY